MKDQRSRAPASVDNIYKLDGRVPVGKAIPFGLQHVLAMFVANVTPVMLIASVAVCNGQAFTAIDTALLIQAAMLIAGIGTLIQLYPVWRIGSRLPVVMGLSFTFLSAMMTLAAKDYGLMIGAVIVVGCYCLLLHCGWFRFPSVTKGPLLLLLYDKSRRLSREKSCLPFERDKNKSFLPGFDDGAEDIQLIVV